MSSEQFNLLKSICLNCSLTDAQVKYSSVYCSYTCGLVLFIAHHVLEDDPSFTQSWSLVKPLLHPLACLLHLTSPVTLQLYHSGTMFASGKVTSHILLCTNQPLSNHTRQPPDIQLENYNVSVALTEIFMVLVIHWITRGNSWTRGRVPHPPGSADIPV